MLLEKIKSDLKQAMKEKDYVKKDTLRMVLGEIPRLNKKAGETVLNSEVEAIIIKLIKSERIVLEASGVDPDESQYINILASYLPKMMSEEEIIEWMNININVQDFNPRMKAMGIIMGKLKGKADGNLVKKILTTM